MKPLMSDDKLNSQPNDKPALDLMNACASKVLNEYHDVILAYGQSDEYSFVFRKDTDLYKRRSAKVGETGTLFFSHNPDQNSMISNSS